MSYSLVPERPGDADLIDPLLDRTFGPERFTKTVYRLREGIRPVPGLSFVATGEDEQLLATLRFWPVLVEDAAAILLGPLAVEPRLQGRGIGKALVRHGLIEAKRRGHALCLVVGDVSYYQPYGFQAAMPRGFMLPGPVDPPRFQFLDLRPGASEEIRGLVRRDESAADDALRQRA